MYGPLAMRRDRSVSLVIVCAFGCGHAAEPSRTPSPPAPSSSTARVSYDLPGDGNGATWDDTEHVLYITDDTHEQIVRWSDARGFETVGAFAGTKLGLGGLVRLGDGSFVTTSFGFGKEGGVLVMRDGHATAVPGLDPVRRRIGLARAPDGVLYDAYFVVRPDKKHTGGVARLDLAGHEDAIAVPDLQKAVGVAATATTLFISDQQRSAIVAYNLATGAATTLAADVPSVDLLALLPNGDLVTGGKRGAVYRIDKSGHAQTIADGFEQVRGVAFDAAGSRLFVIEHGANDRHRLHVVPMR
jgi:sugar lactone lactonase YvrE